MKTDWTDVKGDHAGANVVPILSGSTNATPKPEAGEPIFTMDACAIGEPIPPTVWACQGLEFCPGAPGMFGGYGFSGKTVAAQSLAVSSARGVAAWGSLAMRKGRVLHLDYEQGRRLSSLRYQRLARGMGFDVRELGSDLVLAPLPNVYVDGDANDQIERLADGFDVVIVDSLRASAPGTDENSSEVRAVLDRMTRISERSGATFLVIHHARKTQAKNPSGPEQSIRGSSGLFDACGSIFVLEAHKGDPVHIEHVKARETGRPRDPFNLLIEDVLTDDGDPRGGLRVSYQDLEPKTEKQAPAEKFSQLKRSIIGLITSEGSILGSHALRARLGGRQDDMSAALAELVASGAIARNGKYNAWTYELPGGNA